MIRLAAAVALALAALAGTASAETFAVVPNSLPSAETPNSGAALVLPRDWTLRAIAVQQRPPQTLEPLWRSAGAAYGIPWQVLAAINQIESNFGQNMGPSSAGAVGWMQFMPDTWRRWGMDASGDGVADPWNPDDAVYSAARYLAAAGGRLDIRRAIFAYNHADWYVEDVLALAGQYGEGTPGYAPVAASYGGAAQVVAPEVSFSLDRARLAVEKAGREVAAANERLVEAVEAERRAARAERGLARVEARLRGREESASLLSKRLLFQKRAARVALRRDAAQRRVEELRRVVEEREKAVEEREESLRRAREEAKRAQFAAASTPPLPSMYGLNYSAAGYPLPAAPVGGSGYVFPVGGGPRTVSVSPDHHDYPAADIAAPMGAPVYSLSAATVVSAWHLPDGRCGIGLTLGTTDGQTWTYCHLSYLDPSVRAGVALSAGANVGLVGSTGRSTGPHLHLQLQPAASYPQDQPWFRSFAGTAFRWQDGGPRRPLGSGPAPAAAVFAVVPSEAAAGDGEQVTFTR